MAYADFEFYSTVFIGTAIAETDFPAVAEKASVYIDYLTRGKATGTDAVKRACCALAEVYDAHHKALAASGGGELASQSVGSYSVTYRSGDEVSASYEKELHKTARMYLANTGLLYRGCCGCIHPTR